MEASYCCPAQIRSFLALSTLEPNILQSEADTSNTSLPLLQQPKKAMEINLPKGIAEGCWKLESSRTRGNLHEESWKGIASFHG